MESNHPTVIHYLGKVTMDVMMARSELLPGPDRDVEAARRYLDAAMRALNGLAMIVDDDSAEFGPVPGSFADDGSWPSAYNHPEPI